MSTSTQPRESSRARSALAFLLLALLLGGAGYFWRSRGGPAARAPATAGVPGRNLRAGLPAWANDPDAEPAAIEGVVKAPDGRGIDGALVAIVPQVEGDNDLRIKPAATTRTAGGGRFRVDKLRPGSYGASATAEGFVGAFKGALELLPGETLRGIEIVLGVGGALVSGHVTDSGGGAVPRAEVRARAATGRGAEARVFAGVADAEGAYRLRVPKDRYVFVADAEGYAPDAHFAEVSGDRTLDFKLNPSAHLSGRVVDRKSGSAVADAQVTLVDDDVWWTQPRQSQTNADGVFTFRDLDPGAYGLSAQKGRLVGTLGRRIAITLASQVDGVVLFVDAGLVVAGRTLKRATGGGPGEPLPGARVRLDQGLVGMRGGRVRAHSGPDGAWRIEGVQPGRYAVSAEAKGFARATREVPVPTGQDVESVDLLLAAESAVIGQVSSKEGQGVAGVAVTAFVTGGSGGGPLGGFGGWATDRTADDGSYRLGGLGDGRVRVDADDSERGHASFGPEPLAAGETKTVNLVIEQGALISGRVSFDDGTIAAGIGVTGVQPMAGGMRQARTGADGTYRVGPFSPGSVMVSASRKEGMGAFLSMRFGRGGGKEMRSVEVEGNEQKTGIDLVIEKGGLTIAGLVLDPDGNPLPGASVGASPGDGAGGSMRMAMMGMGGGGDKIYSGQDGTFTIPDLGRGLYTVWAKMPDLPDAESKGIAGGATGVRVQFKKPAMLAGVVVDQGGKPVADYSVQARVSAPPGETGELRMMRMAGSWMSQSRVDVHDPTGVFEMRGLAAGNWDLLVSTADGKVGKQLTVPLGEGEQKRDLRISVDLGVTLRAKVVEHPSGAPLGGTNTIAQVGGQPAFRTTDAQGAFAYESLTPGVNLSVMVGMGMGMGMGGGSGPSYIPESRDFAIPEATSGKSEIDGGTVKLVRGQFRPGEDRGGVGLTPDSKDGRAVVVAVTPGSPAAQGGVRVGNLVQTIDGQEVSDLGRNGLGWLIGGKAGTQVALGVQSPGAETRVVILTRVARATLDAGGGPGAGPPGGQGPQGQGQARQTP